jgi:hypothetical protein
MTNIAAKTALDEFIKDVDRATQLLDLTSVFREFAGQQEEPSGSAYDLWNAAKEVRTDLPIFSGSILLYLCGRFESFVRELVGAIVDDLVDKATSYDELPPVLRKVYLTRTLAINESPRKYDHTPETAAVLASELANNLAGGGSSGSSLRVSASTITITESNMNPNTLDDLFKRVGISRAWDTLGKQLSLKRNLNEVTDDGCKRAAMARLEEIMKERNRVAHPTAATLTVFPDANSVKDMAEYLRVLAQVLAELALAPR